MRDYLTLGATPCEEPCAQVGEHNYSSKARREGNAYINQLKRMFGDPPGESYFTIKSFPHDFGTYHEVAIVFDPDNKIEVEFAYKLDRELPGNWDDQAKAELNQIKEEV